MRSFRFDRSLSFAFAGIFTAMVLAGCGPGGPKLYPVHGKVLFKDQPAAGAQVVFQPVSSADALPGEATFSSGTVDADGSFALQTYPHGAGAPVGEYNVILTWFPPNTGEVGNPINKLPAKYADQQRPLLKATVKEENNELPPFKLTP